jgi:copper chaperone CopZ
VTQSGSDAKAIFSLYSLGCSSCSRRLETRLRKVPGISEVNVNYIADMVQVRFNPNQVTSDEIRNFMKKLGYESGKRS